MTSSAGSESVLSKTGKVPSSMARICEGEANVSQEKRALRFDQLAHLLWRLLMQHEKPFQGSDPGLLKVAEELEGESVNGRLIVKRILLLRCSYGR